MNEKRPGRICVRALRHERRTDMKRFAALGLAAALLTALFTACAAKPMGNEYPFAEHSGMMDSEIRESPDGYMPTVLHALTLSSNGSL